jgi:hypothetical protein
MTASPAAVAVNASETNTMARAIRAMSRVWMGMIVLEEMTGL